MPHHYVIVDFECTEPNQWQSVGIVLYERRGTCGRIVRKLHVACDRGDTVSSSTSRVFWSRNKAAFDYNVRMGKGRSIEAAETDICAFVVDLKRAFPHFYLLSDNPEYDVALLNSILTRHDLSVMSHRSETIYHQAICTWSSRRTLGLLGLKHQTTDMVGLCRYHERGMLAHTPLFDCMKILNDYLCTIDSIAQHTVPRRCPHDEQTKSYP